MRDRHEIITDGTVKFCDVANQASQRDSRLWMGDRSEFRCSTQPLMPSTISSATNTRAERNRARRSVTSPNTTSPNLGAI